MKMFKQKSLQQEQGFTLVEVLVAILITTLFVAVSMQAMVFAAVFKARAQESAEATNWIQEDLENVKYQAANLKLPQSTLTANAAKDTSLITVTSSTNFALNDEVKVGLDTAIYQISAKSGTTLTIKPKLGTDQFTNAAVVETTMCNPSARNIGLADALRNLITDTDPSNGITDITSNENYIDSDPPKQFRTGKKFTMRKTTTLYDASPYNVLQIKYEVSPGTTFDSSKVLANFNTEVIPNVAFECPQ